MDAAGARANRGERRATASFAFSTTWGANLIDGGARFSVWAPGQQTVRLKDIDSDRTIGMSRTDEGWFATETDAIAPGRRYAFVLGCDLAIPDPASRAQAGDVHGPSVLVDPRGYDWRTAEWRGRPWHEAVIYELHAGAFSGSHDFDGVLRRLDHLERLGVTAIELMPVAQFAGARGWGYDGVLLYAPHVAYGGPGRLKALIDAAHERGLMVFLDVVYNHFGPEGSYLHLLAPEFFHPERVTPWGAAIAYEKEPVRRFIVDNALYWLEEYRLDGLRFDAVDQIDDPSADHILDEIARIVRQRIADRHVHLMTEDDRNDVRHLERDEAGRPRLFTAEWNDDFHHVTHVIATSDTEGYYQDYAEDSASRLARALSEGFIYQGEASSYRDGARRGVPSAHLPPTAFVNFLQNHDQIGNRAFGERLTDLASPQVVEMLLAVLLLSPSIPLLYMGEEWGETRPFAFFCDFHGELAKAVRDGRRNEFKRWPKFQDPKHRDLIPDPNALSTFEASMLDWSKLEVEAHRRRLGYVRDLLMLRAREITPRLDGAEGGRSRARTEGTMLDVAWILGDGSELTLVANLCAEPRPPFDPPPPGGRVLFEWPGTDPGSGAREAPGWACGYRLMEANRR